MGWVGVDLDGTLARKAKPKPTIGEPIGPMINRVRKWVADGREVRVVTARVSGYLSEPGSAEYQEAVEQELRIALWCAQHLGHVLPVQCHKDPDMIELWDDRAVGVVVDEGILVADAQYALGHFLGERDQVSSRQEYEVVRARTLHALQQIDPYELVASPHRFVDFIIRAVRGGAGG